MGEIERAIKTKVRRTRINSAIIKTLAVMGAIGVAVVAPNVLQVFKQFGLVNHRQSKRRVSASLNRLIENGYVKFESNGPKRRLMLTAIGEKFAALLGEGRLMANKPKRWDGKWRILIFDIPEKRKNVREQVRRTLVDLGFIRLQDSVWVYPYDCEDIITIFKIDFNLGRSLLYIVADKIENEVPLKKAFGI